MGHPMNYLSRTARAIMTLLSPIMGTRASGNAAIQGTGSAYDLPIGTYLVPIVGGVANPDGTVKTTAAASIGVAGGQVPVSAVIGGACANLPAGLPMAFDPPMPGAPLGASVAAPGMSGGTSAAGFGALKQIRLYEAITPHAAADDLARAGAGQFPAAALIWNETAALKIAGRGVRHATEEWCLAIVSSRADSDAIRRAEGLQIMSAATSLIFDRGNVDGECFSSPNAIEIRRRYRVPTQAGNAYIYAIEFTTQHTIEKIDSRSFFPWLYTEQTHNTGAPPLNVTTAAGFDMP